VRKLTLDYTDAEYDRVADRAAPSCFCAPSAAS
jgi:hypothetical protein